MQRREQEHVCQITQKETIHSTASSQRAPYCVFVCLGEIVQLPRNRGGFVDVPWTLLTWCPCDFFVFFKLFEGYSCAFVCALAGGDTY